MNIKSRLPCVFSWFDHSEIQQIHSFINIIYSIRKIFPPQKFSTIFQGLWPIVAPELLDSISELFRCSIEIVLFETKIKVLVEFALLLIPRVLGESQSLLGRLTLVHFIPQALLFVSLAPKTKKKVVPSVMDFSNYDEKIRLPLTFHEGGKSSPTDNQCSCRCTC